MTTSDERRAMLALAKDPLFVCATENEALDRLAATVVRLIEERDEIMSRKVFNDLAKANQRIEALRAGLDELSEYILRDMKHDYARQVILQLARDMRKLLIADKEEEATK